MPLAEQHSATQPDDRGGEGSGGTSHNDGKKLCESDGRRGRGELRRAEESWRSRWTRAKDRWRRPTDARDDDDARTSSWRKRRMEVKGAEEAGFVRSELQKAEPERSEAAVEKELQSRTCGLTDA